MVNIRTIKAVIASTIFLFAVSSPSQAIELEIIPTNTAATINPGELFVVKGKVRNTTGADLSTTDIFFNFSGYDPDFIQIDQLLGLDEFSLLDRTLSTEIDLFSILAIGQPASLDPFFIEFFAIDINGVVSSDSVFNVTINRDDNPVDIPEPATSALLVMGSIMMFLCAQMRRRLFRKPHLAR